VSSLLHARHPGPWLGSQIVDFLLEQPFVADRAAAQRLGAYLVDTGLMAHVYGLSAFADAPIPYRFSLL
jgi:hypothetical protein